MNKICSNCKKEKFIFEFSKAKTGKFGVRGDCKECRADYNKKFHLNNKTYNSDYYKQNKSKINLSSKLDYQINKEKYLRLSRKQYDLRKNTIEFKLYRRQYQKRKRELDIKFKITQNLRTRLNKVLKGKNKSQSTIKLLGCSIEFLKKHLESKFKSGMNWNNYGQWHIDHKNPIVTYNLSNPQEQKRCFHYTNLQPLWAEENLKKSKKRI